MSTHRNENFYRCPECHQAGRESDTTKKEGDNIVRTVIYTCYTQLVIMQNGFRFKHKVVPSVRCSEYKSIYAAGQFAK